MKTPMNRWIGMAAAVMLCSGVAQAGLVAALRDDGLIRTADTDAADFAASRTTLATLTAGGNTYIDMTFGDGYIYGLRSDGAVYRSDLSGNVSQVSVNGWDSSFTKIDYANGVLYGMNAGTATVVKDSSGTSRLNVSGFAAGDFGVRSDGQIQIMTGSGSTWVYTFADAYSGTPAGNTGFMNYDNSNDPIALDVNGTLQTVLIQAGAAETWRYQDGVTGPVGGTFAKNNVTDAGYMALKADNSEAYFLSNVSGVMRISSGPVQASSPIALEGDLATGTGVGIVSIPEPATLSMVGCAAAGMLAFRRLQN